MSFHLETAAAPVKSSRSRPVPAAAAATVEATGPSDSIMKGACMSSLPPPAQPVSLEQLSGAFHPNHHHHAIHHQQLLHTSPLNMQSLAYQESSHMAGVLCGKKCKQNIWSMCAKVALHSHFLLIAGAEIQKHYKVLYYSRHKCPIHLLTSTPPVPDSTTVCVFSRHAPHSPCPPAHWAPPAPTNLPPLRPPWPTGPNPFQAS